MATRGFSSDSIMSPDKTDSTMATNQPHQCNINPWRWQTTLPSHVDPWIVVDDFDPTDNNVFSGL